MIGVSGHEVSVQMSIRTWAQALRGGYLVLFLDLHVCLLVAITAVKRMSVLTQEAYCLMLITSYNSWLTSRGADAMASLQSVVRQAWFLVVAAQHLPTQISCPHARMHPLSSMMTAHMSEYRHVAQNADKDTYSRCTSGTEPRPRPRRLRNQGTSRVHGS